MAGTTTVSKAIFVAEEQGVAKVEAQLQKLVGTSKEVQAATAAVAKSQKQAATEMAAAAKGLSGGGGANTFAKTTEQSTRALSQMQNQAERLQKSLDPLYREQVKLAQVQQQITKLVDNDILTRERGNELVATATERFSKFGAETKVANDNVKLTTNQMQGLSYQINDVGTMLAMGASPFQVMASQAGQVVQVLQEGGGIKSSLKAIGTSIVGFGASLGPVGLGLAAASVALAGFVYAFRKDFPDLEESLKKQDELIGKLSKGYDGLRARVEAAGRASKAGGNVESGSVVRDIQALLKSEMRNVDLDFTSYTGQIFEGMLDFADASTRSEFSGLQGTIDKFRRSLKAGSPDVAGFRDELASLYATAGQRGDTAMQKAIEKAYDYTGTLANLSDQAKATAEALRAMSSEQVQFRALGQDFKDAMDALKSAKPDASTEAEKVHSAYELASQSARTLSDAIGAGKAEAAAMTNILQPLMDSLRDAKNNVANLSLSPDQRGLAQIRQRGEAEIEQLERTKGAEAAALRRQQLLAEEQAATIELTRSEDARRAGYALDLRAIGARSAAQKASIEAERVRIDLLSQGYTAVQASQRAEEARALSLAQSSRASAESIRSRNISEQQALDSLRLEAEGLGKSAGEVAKLQAQYQLLAQYKEAAYAEGRDALTSEETARIQAQAEAIGALTDQLDRMRMVREQAEQLRGLDMQASTVGQSDDFARRAAATYEAQRRLREQGQDLNSEFARGQIANAQAMSDYGDAIRRQSDAWEDMRGAGESAIDSLVDGLASGTADIGDILKGIAADFTKTFLQLAVSNPLKNALLGTSYGTLDDLFKKVAAPAMSSAGVSAMGTVTMTAAVVNLNGGATGAVSSLLGGTGAPGTAGAPKTATEAISTLLGAGSGSGKGSFSTVGNYKAGVNSQLTSILQEAAKISGLKVEAFSGLRPGDSRFHGKGLATDIRLFDQAGKAIPNYQNAAGFRPYEKFAQVAKQVQMEKFPELADKFRWGGYFGGQKGKYGAMDTMHFDMGGGKVGMAGGSWERGLNATQRGRFPGAESIGMADKSFKEIETKASSMASSFASTSGKLMPSLTDFVSGFDFNSTVMIDGMSGSVQEFLPKFGGNLSSLLDAVSGGGKGSGGGLLKGIIGSIAGRTGISSGGVAAILANPTGGLYAEGGHITGPGTGTSDSIPAWLSNGEFVVNAKATAQNRAVLEAINSGKRAKFAGGGFVAPPMPSVAQPTGAPAMGGVVINDMRSTGTSQPVEAKMNADGKLEVTIRDLVRSEVTQPGRKTARTLAQSGVQAPLRQL